MLLTEISFEHSLKAFAVSGLAVVLFNLIKTVYVEITINNYTQRYFIQPMNASSDASYISSI